MQAARGTPLNDPKTASPALNDRTPAPRRVRLFAFWAVLVYLLDLSTKTLAVQTLQEPVPLIDGLLTLRLTRNPGAAFSFGTQYTVLLTAVAMVVVVVVIRLAYRLGSTGWAIALGLLLGGACGNLTDRLFRWPGPLRGHVVDFLELPNWPVFNLADAAIVCGAALVVLLSMRGVRLDGSRE